MATQPDDDFSFEIEDENTPVPEDNKPEIDVEDESGH